MVIEVQASGILFDRQDPVLAVASVYPTKHAAATEGRGSPFAPV